jgi:hypothetical protein
LGEPGAKQARLGKQRHYGVIVESSPNRTLSENQKSISMLRKRSFVRQFGLGLKNQTFFVA